MVDETAGTKVVIRDGLRRVGGRNGIRWITLAIRGNIVVDVVKARSEIAENPPIS
jgi:hypothetical protein